MSGEWPAARVARTLSYAPSDCAHTFDDELARLRAQVALSWAVEQRRLAALGVADGQCVLEPGCGPGFVTERLAGWLPQSRIVALDPDPAMLRAARRTLDSHGSGDHVTLLQATAEATGLRSHTFDVAISRYLFQHLRDPGAAAVEVRRVLRPGGVHIVIEVDDGLWGLAEPRLPEFETWHRRRADAQGGRGGDRFRGRRLGRLLREAGYAHVDVDVFACHSDDVGIDAFAAQLDPDQFLPLVAEGLVTFAEYVKARSLYQRFLESEPLVVSVGFIACAEAPL